MAPLAPATSRISRWAALAAFVTLVASGCDAGTGGSPSPSPSLPPSPISEPAGGPAPAPGLAEFYDQELSWADCGTDGPSQCATLRVPVDYAEAAGATIELALLRVPTGSTDRRVGSLVVNPGGPGRSGVDYAASAQSALGAELRDAFDIVGFDPRGVGRSSPVDCLSDADLDAFVAADPDPDTPAEVAEAERLLREFGRGCVELSGELAGHVSTVEAARDLDILREALGDPGLAYYGASYGTLLGATYAELFPHRVGRMVLDGALDPSLSALELNLVQAKGFETALRAYAGACVERGGCFLGGSVDAATRRVRVLLDSVEAAPLPAGERKLAIGNAVLGVWAPLYKQSFWPILDTALRAALDGDGRPLLALSDAYTSRGAAGYVNNSIEALYAVNCLDRPESLPSGAIARQLPRFQKASPTFGAIFAASLGGCEQWPVRSDEEPVEITAEGAAPILVVGTTRDPATPLRWAEALADQLDSGVLVRRDGDGHTGYRAGNGCVDSAVEAYLVSGSVPEDTLDC